MTTRTLYLAIALAAGAVTPLDAQQRAQILPVAEHHTHMVGPTSVSPAPGTPDSVILPSSLAAVLRKRERVISQPNEIPQLFAEDALILDVASGDDYWRRGLEGVKYVVGAYGAGTRYLPIAYSMSGNTAHITAVTPMKDPTKYDMHVMFGLKMDAAGVWKITTEFATVNDAGSFAEPITADKTIQVMDDAGMKYGVVLSVAYWHGSFSRKDSDEAQYPKVRAENDWVVQQVSRFPDRLVAFCSANPLKSYALTELERCSKLPNVRGFKLHFGNSAVDVKNPEHVEKMRTFFAAANRLRMPVVVHLWTLDRSYGADHTRLFLDQILPAAPDIVVQIAHVGGGGRYAYDDVLGVFADAVEAKDARTKNLYFDLTTVVEEATSQEKLQQLTRRLRQIGMDRILFGADTPVKNRPEPLSSWATFRRRMPLTDDELRDIADNVAPYILR